MTGFRVELVIGKNGNIFGILKSFPDYIDENLSKNVPGFNHFRVTLMKTCRAEWMKTLPCIMDECIAV